MKPSALGDVVQSLPILEGLKHRWPHSHITWVIREDLADLVSGHPLVDDWLLYRRRQAGSNSRLLRELAAGAFDMTIDLQGLLRSGLMTLATRSPVRVGLESVREGAWLAHNVVLPRTGRDVPAHQRYRRLIECIAPGYVNRLPMRKSRFGTSERLTLAVHPGALWKSKCWPVGKFAAVAARAAREFGMEVTVIGGPGEQPRSRRLVESLLTLVPAARVTDRTGSTTIAELRDLLHRVDVLLTNDSGPMHLAASVGTPVVGVFLATSPRLSGPECSPDAFAPEHQLVEPSTPCAGCYRRRCPRIGAMKYACHRDLSVDRVWQAFIKLVDDTRQVDAVGAVAIG